MPASDELKTILELLANSASECYLVGGFIRDHFIGCSNAADIDLAVTDDGFDIARSINRKWPEISSFAPLDPVNGCGRLILRDEHGTIVDISRLKGSNIEEDIRNRDFTINAIAIRLADYLKNGLTHLIDPLDGSSDIGARIVRACSTNAFTDDPLRILRAFRFAAQLDFKIETNTQNLLRKSVGGLDNISGERIRDELHHILTTCKAWETLERMDTAGIITRLFPGLSLTKGCEQNRYHSMDVWNHSLSSVRELERLLECPEFVFGTSSSEVRKYTDSEISSGRSRLWLIKLVCLFHDCGKPFTKNVGSDGAIHFYGHEKISVQLFQDMTLRLKLSKRETELASRLIGGHMRLSSLTTAAPSRRFLYRLSERFGEDIIGLLLVFLADLKASCGPARSGEETLMGINGAKETLDYCLEVPQQPISPFLNGSDLKNIFNIPEGPLIGKILGGLKEKQVLGHISSREQAINETARLLEKLVPF